MKGGKVNCFRLDLSYAEYQSMAKNLSYTNIGKYYIYEKIGQGGFGQVYKGMDDDTKLAVAVKIIDLNMIKQQKNERLREIKLKLSRNQDKMMERCNSPNLIKCYDVYQNEDLKIIVMEFCNGGTLEKHIQDRGKIPQKQAILILKQILNGIKELHSHKIIHRDLKADNILLDNTLFKIADFGFSKALDITNQNMIGVHTLLGTITTMAPEVMARQKYGLKADIWSIGVIFFQMLFGRLPFNGNTKQQMYGMIIESDLMKKDSLKIYGTSISKSAYDFLKLILVVDQKKRIGWRQLVNHPIFIEKHTDKMSRVFIQNQQIKLPDNVDDQFNPEEFQNSNTFRKQTQTAKIIKIVSQKIKGKQQQLQLSQQDRAFLWMNQKLYQCLKAELIYQQVICKIKDNKLLDLQEREVIQFLYLLSTRCFLDLSPINAQMQKMYKLYPSFTQIYQTVRKLYERLKDSWNYYTKIITEIENGLFNRFKDFFLQKNQVIDQRNKFMNGIQNIDYQRKQQLNFIQKQFIRNLRTKITNVQFKIVKQYLLFYSEICLAQPSQLKKQGFDAFIERLVSH